MEIKNKNIFLNLNEGEEIVYVAQKDKANFWWNFIFLTFIGIPLISFSTFLIITNNIDGIPSWYKPFMVLILFSLFFVIYKIIVDYFYTELIFTNKRFIISKFNKIRFINYELVKRITGSYGYRNSGPIATTIKLTTNKSYRLFCIDRNIVRNKLKELYPDYDDSKAVAKEQKLGYIILVILLLLLPFLTYAEYKLKLANNQNKPHKAAHHQQYSKDPKSKYFDPYMYNLQNEIKKNWHPPKNNESKDVVVKFTIAKDGSLIKTNIIKSSNNMAIDRSAIEALQNSAPFAPLPKQFKEESVDIEFTFDYNVLGRG